MARSSIALFLVTTGLITATMGCAHSPGSKDQEGGENGVSAPAPERPAEGAPEGADREGDRDGDGDAGEAGEGGEGGES
ncbi:hypothetical protein [Cyanobium gracile]|uniref:Uncharacterized protein n=1 Tax=Cyanobium gracile (strain ATCC 27147 / PCC 6307) TaxID=292564 RepID=K9P733_CYAGP|nr:hypothetical protein [Cyanobium gracile]AFY29217.1 hypothetical protein Cyagr_2097 [Cyanobium gracile PCC 6307]